MFANILNMCSLRCICCVFLCLCQLAASGVLPGDKLPVIGAGAGSKILIQRDSSSASAREKLNYLLEYDTSRHRRAAGTGTEEDVLKTSKCSGGFDIYFVLDRSGSVTEEQFQLQTVNFADALLTRFTSSKVRASFIIFSSESEVITSLTGDGDVLSQGIESLRSVTTEGGTYLHRGIREAVKQIKETGGDTASVIVTLTDGILDDKTDSIRQADKARQLGATVLAVRVGDSNINDIADVANKPTSDHIFKGDTFNDLDQIIDKIVNTSCVEILSASPTEVCTGETFNVTISGNGFSKTNDVSKVRCNFRLNDTDNQEVEPYLVTDSELVCPAPQLDETNSFVVLQVSVNGISYISSNVTISAKNCTPPDVTGIILGLFFALLLLGLFLLWWFWQILCCVVVVKPPPPPPGPPASPNSKKWPTVDASYYGGGGVGGIKAMRVNWGQNGCTEGGSHLEKAKGAQLLAMNEEGDEAGLTGNKPSCLQSLKKKLAACFAPVKSFYNRISVMRPAPGQKGKCCQVHH